MILKVKESSFIGITNNSSECSENIAFLDTVLSHKYRDDAKNHGCLEFITPQKLSEIVNLESIKIIGITGTNGKTTTAAAIYSFLLDLGYKVALQGTRGFFINDKQYQDKTLTTPSLLDNYSNILTAIEHSCDFFVMEVSSHALTQERVEKLKFDLKILTNITSDHLDYHNTIEEYINVKNGFFQDETKKLINSDIKVVKYNYVNSITYAIEESGYSKIHAYSLRDGISASIQYFQEVEEFYSSLHGLFNLYNLQAAIIAVKMLTDKPLKEICSVVDNFAGVAGRLEIISNTPFIAIDFAHTEDGMKQIFDTFDDKPIVVVFGAGGNRDRTKRPLMGRMASHYASRIYLTSDNPRDENPLDIIDDILIGIKNRDKVVVEENRVLAIQQAISTLHENERLFILGKGDETTQEIKGVYIPMSDKEIIKDFIFI